MEELITVICNQISRMLNSVTFRITPPSFGVKDVIRMLEKVGGDVCMVGIYGQSGIGKTTIAKAVYDQLSHEFDDSAFIPYVCPFEERKWQFKQQRALIVFDDVDELDKFESRQIFDPDLFHKGSKIIVIAKDKRDLVRYGVKEENIYFAHELNNMQSLRLLGYYAFKGKKPTDEIVGLARKVTEFAGGLPLGLAVLGSLLSSMRTKEEWETMFEKLSNAPGEGIHKVLKVRMDALDPNQLQVFFDIAYLKRCVSSLWKDNGHYPSNTIKFLEEKCLISLDAEDWPIMHNRIRNYGKKWGAQKGYYKCWVPAMKFLDGLDLHQQNIFLDVACCLIGHEKEYATYMWEDCGYSPANAIQVLQDRSLISIDEKGRFRMDDKIRDVGRSMVEKREHTPCFYSRIWNQKDLREALDDWKPDSSNDHIQGINVIFGQRLPLRIEAMGNLRVLHLTNCYFQYNRLQPLQNLRWLRMERCDVNSWIFKDGGIIDKLLVLQLHNCGVACTGQSRVVQRLDQTQVIKKLKVLEIIHCRDVGMTSQDFSLMPSLVKLVIEYSWKFYQIPKSIWGLGKLEYLRIRGGEMKKLSSSINNLSSLQTLDLGRSSCLLELPNELGDLAALRELILSSCALFEIPSSVVQLNHLRTLIVSGCGNLHCLPQLPSSLITLVAFECSKLRRVADISSLKDLRTLNLDRCGVLQDVPGLQNLQSLTFLKLPFHSFI